MAWDKRGTQVYLKIAVSFNTQDHIYWEGKIVINTKVGLSI